MTGHQELHPEDNKPWSEVRGRDGARRRQRPDVHVLAQMSNMVAGKRARYEIQEELTPL